MPLKYCLLSICIMFSAFLSKAQSLAVFKTNNYTFSYPQSWTIDTSRTMGIDVFVLSQVDTITDKFRENVNVLSSNVEGQHVTLDTVVKVSLNQIKGMMNDLQIIESKIYERDGTTYHKIDFMATQGIFKLRCVQYYLVTKKFVYTVTLTAEVDKYEKYKEVGTKVLDSFTALQ
jgi:hypothetical protein